FRSPANSSFHGRPAQAPQAAEPTALPRNSRDASFFVSASFLLIISFGPGSGFPALGISVARIYRRPFVAGGPFGNHFDCLRLVVKIALHNSTHTRQHTTVIHTDQGHTLRGPAHFADFRHARTNQHTAGGYQHNLVIRIDQYGANDLAVAWRGLNRDHALGTAPMTGVFNNRGSLAKPVFRGSQHGL